MESPRLSRPTNLTDRVRFVWMWISGMSARAIAQETGTSVTTVCRWIQRWRQEGNVNTKTRSGRPCKKMIRKGKKNHVYLSPIKCQPPVTSLDVLHNMQYFPGAYNLHWGLHGRAELDYSWSYFQCLKQLE